MAGRQRHSLILMAANKGYACRCPDQRDASSPGLRRCLPQEWVQPLSTPGEWSQGSGDRNKDGQYKEQMSIFFI